MNFSKSQPIQFGNKGINEKTINIISIIRIRLESGTATRLANKNRRGN
jgi:hypothetical protein